MRWYAAWRLVVNNAVLGFYYAVVNLIPAGYSDGTMLWHLVLWTRPGKELISRSVLSRFYADAEEYHYQTDFDREIEVCQQALRLAQMEVRESPLLVALCHQRLGHAHLAAQSWHAAENAFRKSLSFEPECSAEPALAANAW